MKRTDPFDPAAKAECHDGLINVKIDTEGPYLVMALKPGGGECTIYRLHRTDAYRLQKEIAAMICASWIREL